MMKLYDETVYRAEQAKEERVRRLLGFCRDRVPAPSPTPWTSRLSCPGGT